MNLYSLKVKGFRKLHDVEINFSDATFLIGENNAGKSSVIEALRHLLSAKDKIELDDFSAGDDDREIVIEANFHNLPEESVGWRGFAGRVIRYSESNESDTGLGFRYRKICGADGSPRIEAMQNDLKGEYKDFTTINDLLENGLAENDLPEELKDVDRDKKLAQKDRNTLLTYTPSIYGESAETTSWVENPGGIKQNVLSRLPMLVTIPAQGDNTDIQAQKGVLHDLLEVLFEDLKVESDAYKKAQQYLSEFSRLMDPMNEETSAHKMIDDINTILSRVFDGAKLNVETAFSGADSVKPSFNVTMSSNIATSVDKQGTGLTRAALFCNTEIQG